MTVAGHVYMERHVVGMLLWTDFKYILYQLHVWYKVLYLMGCI
jgi:hypothetical protein